MFNVKQSESFMRGFNPDDPMNRISPVEALASTTALSQQIDAFVRSALRKAISDETVEMFSTLGIAIPFLDLNMTLHSPHKRSLEVVFNGKVLGRVTFETSVQEQDAGGVKVRTIVHQTKDVVL